MKLKKFDHMDCAIAQTLDIIGERWSLLIIRDIFLGLRQFDQIQKNLDIARNVLTARLNRLLEEDVIYKTPINGRSYEYKLTEKGLDLHTVLVSMTHWGEKYMGKAEGERVIFTERETGEPVAPMSVRNADGKPLNVREFIAEAGPGVAPKKNSGQ